MARDDVLPPDPWAAGHQEEATLRVLGSADWPWALGEVLEDAADGGTIRLVPIGTTLEATIAAIRRAVEDVREPAARYHSSAWTLDGPDSRGPFDGSDDGFWAGKSPMADPVPAALDGGTHVWMEDWTAAWGPFGVRRLAAGWGHDISSRRPGLMGTSAHLAVCFGTPEDPGGYGLAEVHFQSEAESFGTVLDWRGPAGRRAVPAVLGLASRLLAGEDLGGLARELGLEPWAWEEPGDPDRA